MGLFSLNPLHLGILQPQNFESTQLETALVEREQIMQIVWREKTVEDANLAVQISNLRDSIGRRSIQTVPGRGYRFIAPLKQPLTNAHVTAPVISQAVTCPRLSIVVLLFANLSEDRTQQYFADAITDDLTTDLSRIDDMFVISCNTAFTYRGRPANTKQIGRELGVRYVLEGSVRRVGNQVRVNVRLINSETDAHLWAERSDRDIGDLFALQDEITGWIANTLNLALIGADAARPTEHPDALDYIFRGRAAYNRPTTRDSLAKAMALFEHALALDPHSVEAQSWLARTFAGRVSNQMSDTKVADTARAEELIAQALAVSPSYPVAHYAKGFLLTTQSRRAEAIPEFEAVVPPIATGQLWTCPGLVERDWFNRRPFFRTEPGL